MSKVGSIIVETCLVNTEGPTLCWTWEPFKLPNKRVHIPFMRSTRYDNGTWRMLVYVATGKTVSAIPVLSPLITILGQLLAITFPRHSKSMVVFCSLMTTVVEDSVRVESFYVCAERRANCQNKDISQIRNHNRVQLPLVRFGISQFLREECPRPSMGKNRETEKWED